VKTGNREEKSGSHFFSLERDNRSWCPWATKLQVVGLIITRRQLRPSFDHSFYYLIYLLKESAEIAEMEWAFVPFAIIV
jgi:hypothetical protein